MVDDERRAWIARACAAWLEDELLPLALGVHGRAPAPAAVVLAALRADRDVAAFDAGALGSWDERRGDELLDDLAIVDAAVMIAHWAGHEPRARDARDAIVRLAYVDAVEVSRARDLDFDTNLEGIGQDPEFAARADRAFDVRDRWLALAAPVAAALAGLFAQLAPDVRERAGIPSPLSG